MIDNNALSRIAFEEVHALHVLIEDWFNARLPLAELDRLLAHFSDDFSMVGIGGLRLHKTALADFFATAHGRRRGLRIGLDELTFIALPGGACGVRYREEQTDAQGIATQREALAVLVPDADGALRWRALHETPIRIQN